MVGIVCYMLHTAFRKGLRLKGQRPFLVKNV